MLGVAEQRVAAMATGDGSLSIDWVVADAASTALEAASIDVAISSFVLQLVADRGAVLREVHRLLRSGGVIAFVTWIAEELQLVADSEFDEAVHELELDDPESVFREPKPGDYESLEEAADELTEAGFTNIDVRADELAYSWTIDSYLRFKESFDERELFESLVRSDRERLRASVRKRWEVLPDSAFTLRAPLVSALARRP